MCLLFRIRYLFFFVEYQQPWLPGFFSYPWVTGCGSYHLFCKDTINPWILNSLLKVSHSHVKGGSFKQDKQSALLLSVTNNPTNKKLNKRSAKTKELAKPHYKRRKDSRMNWSKSQQIRIVIRSIGRRHKADNITCHGFFSRKFK